MSPVIRKTDSDIAALLSGKGLDGDIAYWQRYLGKINNSDVQRVLNGRTGGYSLEKLATLVSPAAGGYLEEMAQSAHNLTVQRFGRTLRLYAPLYLSNYCSNSCRYCGFNRDNVFERKRLTIAEAEAEADVIASKGFRDILLVSGEDKEFISVDYLCELAAKLRDKFSAVSVEVYQMQADEYARLFAAGIDGVTIYQETYDRGAYEYYHPGGGKADYDSRLCTPEKAAAGAMRSVGLGVLLGLSDWRVETLALAEHGHFLMKRYWQCRVSFSFPRLRPAFDVNNEDFEHLLGDKDLVQMITALRLCFPDVGLVLSTRERAGLRDHLVKLGITRLSAGSKTNPGGYRSDNETGRQFEIDDKRSSAEVATMLRKSGFDVIWKDWDKGFRS